MTFKSNILKPFNSELYEQSTGEIVSIIYDYLFEQRGKIKYLSHGLLKNRIGSEYSDEEIMLAARALAALKKPLLEEKYEFVTSNYRITISRKVLNRSIKEGVFIHPNTGEEIKNFDELIHIFYVPHESFLKQLKSEDS